MIKQIKFLTLLFFMNVIMGHSAFADKKSIPLDGIAAVVNDAIITSSELNQSVETIKKQLTASHVSLPTQDVLRKQVLDRLVNKKLQLQLAEQMGAAISDNELNKTIRGIADNNKISVDELYKRVAEQGINASEYRKEIREELTIHQVQQKNVSSKITITPQEIDDFLRSKAWQAFSHKEYHLEDILIALPEAPTPQDMASAKKKAEVLLAKIRKGLSFQEAAVAESGESNALQGGDLGWRKLPEIPAIFSEQLVNMKQDDILGPVQAPNGFHIIKLSGIREAGGKQNPAQVRNQVQQLIFQRKFEEALQSWITKIRSEAFINTHPES